MHHWWFVNGWLKVFEYIEMRVSTENMVVYVENPLVIGWKTMMDSTFALKNDSIYGKRDYLQRFQSKNTHLLNPLLFSPSSFLALYFLFLFHTLTNGQLPPFINQGGSQGRHYSLFKGSNELLDFKYIYIYIYLLV